MQLFAVTSQNANKRLFLLIQLCYTNCFKWIQFSGTVAAVCSDFAKWEQKALHVNIVTSNLPNKLNENRKPITTSLHSCEQLSSSHLAKLMQIASTLKQLLSIPGSVLVITMCMTDCLVLVSFPDPTHERGSGDIRLIPRVSLTLITFRIEISHIAENTICSATSESLGYLGTMTQHLFGV